MRESDLVPQSSPNAAPSVPDLLKLFARLWREKFGRVYAVAWKKEGAQLKRLVKEGHQEGELARYIAFYLKEFRDPFAERAGYSLGVFVSLLPAVVAASAAAEAKRAKALESSSDFERLEEARKRLGGGES